VNCPACTGGVKLKSDRSGMLVCPECRTMVSPPMDSIDLLTPPSTIRPLERHPRPQSVDTPFSQAFHAQYEMIKVLGEGSMGMVYLMKQRKLDRLVAVKVVRGDSLTYDETKRLQREARVLASVSNPAILALYDVGTDGTVPYMVCEYVDGETLADRIRRPPPLTTSQIVRIALHVLDGVRAAHKQGIIHRDLKPGNIFLSDSGRPKIGDFGMAKAQNSTSGSSLNHIVGTPPYMSPEQCRGQGVSFSSDLYAVGVLLFEMTTGQRPFQGPSVLDFLNQHCEVKPPLLRSVREDVPDALENIVQRALEKDPAKRYKTAGSFRRELLELYRSLLPAGDRSGDKEHDAPAKSGPFNAEPGVILSERYELVRVLGQGGMGQVWLAKDRVMDGADVAVKILPPELWRDVEAQTNLKHEARLTQKLAHPNIVRLMTLEPGEEGDPPVLVMEYVPGKTLAHLLIRRENEKRNVTAEEIWPILDGLCSALDHAHQKGLVHRDIKPSNVLLEPRPDGTFNAKLADFGIAAEVTSFRTRQTGVVPKGTLTYMSPEQVACRKLDGRSDVYALAATVYQALAGKPPFTGNDVSQAILHEQVKMPENLAPGVSQALEKALAKKPDERYSNAGEFAMAYYQALQSADPGKAPGMGTQESLSTVGRATRQKIQALTAEQKARGTEGHPPPPWVSDERPELPPPPPATSPAAMIFALGVLLLGIAALVYALRGDRMALDIPIAPARTPAPGQDSPPKR
jgi:serine/threonine protein kinase